MQAVRISLSIETTIDGLPEDVLNWIHYMNEGSQEAIIEALEILDPNPLNCEKVPGVRVTAELISAVSSPV